MKKYLFITLLLILFPVFTSTLSNKSILVLGTETSLFDDIQDRILREKIMHMLTENNYQVVPVMETERLILEDGLTIRKPLLSKVIYFTKKTNASYTFFSKLEKSKDKYIYSLYVYSLDKNKIFNKVAIIDKENNFEKLQSTLTKTALKNIILLMEEKDAAIH